MVDGLELYVRLPSREQHVPRQHDLPDAEGVPVTMGQDGPVVGRVLGWRSRGDGYADAQIRVTDREAEIRELLDVPGEPTVGMNARAETTLREDGVKVVERITAVDSVTILLPHER